MKGRASRVVASGALLLAANARADGLLPGDPEERIPLGLAGLVAALVVAAALYGLHRIRRAHDLLPPP